VAVRVPAHDFLRRLCRRVGPLVSTSANRSGRPAPRTCADALADVGEFATLAVDAGPGRAQLSTIVDVTGTAPKLLRAGAIAWVEIAAVLRRGPA
jgi:tRNA A37 threonylcarbamoyladenosine synthetase subunit TsaC/SUA5/YrdC